MRGHPPKFKTPRAPVRPQPAAEATREVWMSVIRFQFVDSKAKLQRMLLRLLKLYQNLCDSKTAHSTSRQLDRWRRCRWVRYSLAMSEQQPSSATELNPLEHTASSYLRSARHQPVQWHPWGDEAFKCAKAEDKPILLAIGAVWCHWCHVMDRESYEDAELARVINQHYIAIKVDRDERPDV